MIQAAALLPIAPILLLPFILIFFIVVFPFWAVGVILLGALRFIVRLAAGADSPAATRVNAWFRWVLTFGGFAETYGIGTKSSNSPTGTTGTTGTTTTKSATGPSQPPRT
jgi:hypothetical protein